MKSSKNKKAVIVGLFSIVGIAIFLVGVFALGGQHSLFVTTITVKASFTDVNGLTAGNNVWFEGVKVGTVKSVSLSGKPGVEIQMNIGKKSCQYIHNDAKAKIGSDGLIGNRIVIIMGGTADSPVIKDGDIIEAEKALTTDDLVNTLQKNNLNLLDITGDLKTISRRIANGEGTIGKLLKDESLVSNLQSVVDIVKQASVNTRQITSNLESYSSKLEAKGSFANDLVTDTIIFSKLRETVIHIREISKTIAVVAADLQTAGENINDSSKPIGALIHDREAADNLKTILKNLASGSHKLDEDLEALQHNFLLRGFFRKKEKEEAKAKK
ncbi:MAG: MlaD family protein [Bacteroidota bacterium]|nr:MlaD family protein [Bacteroidota bacterium]